MLLGGVDDKPELYLIDELGTLVKDNYLVCGIGSHFTYAMLDKYWHENMGLDEATELIQKCIKEIQRRVLVSSSHYCIEVCYCDHTNTIQGEIPFPPVN